MKNMRALAREDGKEPSQRVQAFDIRISNIRTNILAMLALVLLCAGRGTAQIVANIDFNYSNDGSETYVGQGAYFDTGHNFWNIMQEDTINTA